MGKLFEKYECSFDSYKKILKDIKNSGKYMDFIQAGEADNFIVLRHDIEFSIERAYNLSKVEDQQEIKSSYFVQITNNAYNALSGRNIMMLRDMAARGHHLGLHYHRDVEIVGENNIAKEIIRQSEILSEFVGVKVDRFSLHRPLEQHLVNEIVVNGLINVYSHKFFTFTKDPSAQLNVKYIADSNHQWKYGIPNKECFEKNKKVQVLIHPLSWTEAGSDHLHCFKDILNEKHQEMIETIEGEWKIFDELRGKL